jgi:type IV pilus assembly protein PilM
LDFSASYGDKVLADLARLRFAPLRGAKNAVSPIGLEFADQRCNVVQLSSGNPPTIRAHASVSYPVARAELLNSPAGLKSFLKQVLKTGGFSGTKVITALPSEDVRILSVTYQVRPGQSDDSAIVKLMQDRIGDDLSQFVIDYVPVRTESREGDRLAMVLLSERSTVINYLEQLRKAGLAVEALEVTPVAIRRLVSTLISAGDAPKNVLTIDTGESKTHLTMISGERLLFNQEIDFGESQVLEQISIALDSPRELAREMIFRQGLTTAATVNPAGVDDTSSTNTILTILRPQFSNLVAEVRRAVLFASSETRGGEVGQAFLIGAIAQWPGAAELLSELAEMPVCAPRPLSLADESTDDGTARPELVIPAGLALRGFADA